MTDLELMQSIKARWGMAIAAHCHSSSVPESFLAALIANESGGNPDAQRFEPKVFVSLTAVLAGAQSHFGSIHQQDLFVYVLPDSVSVGTLADARAEFPAAMQRIRDLATSWGLTQIMGYNSISKGIVERLKQPDYALDFTLAMLAEFAHRFSLDLASDFSDLFRCWNTGSPNGITFDPAYVPNGLARKAAYEALP